MSSPQIHGEVLPGWEPVRDAFCENFVSRGEIGAACGVYQHGVKVVDLWGGWRDPKTKSPWAEDTMVIVFSTTSITARTFANPKVIGAPHRYNDRDVWRIELPASNGIGCPRDIAKVYGELAAGGKTLGLQATTLDELRRSATPPSGGLVDLVLRLPTAFTLGFGKPNHLFPFGSASAFGTPGAGGSLGFADPELGLGFGYGMNRLDFYLYDDPRHKSLREAATACAKRALRS